MYDVPWRSRDEHLPYDERLPALVRVGDPLRNIAPCIPCPASSIRNWERPGSKECQNVLVDQLTAFVAGARLNDPGAQMRNMVRAMTPREIDEVAAFYARKASAGEPEQAALILQP
jgi:hypothetical protein